jgi:hypothetical protein
MCSLITFGISAGHLHVERRGGSFTTGFCTILGFFGFAIESFEICEWSELESSSSSSSSSTLASFSEADDEDSEEEVSSQTDLLLAFFEGWSSHSAALRACFGNSAALGACFGISTRGEGKSLIGIQIFEPVAAVLDQVILPVEVEVEVDF